MRVKKRFDKRSYFSGKKDTNYIKPVIIVLSVLIFIVVLYFIMRILSIRNSEEFSMDNLSIYYLSYEALLQQQNTDNKSNNLGRLNKLIIVEGKRKIVHIINVPINLFIFSKNVSAQSTNSQEFTTLFTELLGIKSAYMYNITLKKDYLKKLGVRNAEEMVEHLSKRGLRFVDYFFLANQVKSLRPESVITEASLAKLYESLGKFNIRHYEVPTLTKFPIRIKVGGKTYIRIYADEEKLNDLKNELVK
ncbi:MAG: hypothetical protein ABDH59_04875 [Fervidobacterium sp.]